MPSTRTEDHIPVRPPPPWPITIPAKMVLRALESGTRPGLLYSEDELFEILEQPGGGNDTLEHFDYPRTTRARNRSGSGLTFALEILWSNGYIRKFARGRFAAGAGGRAFGVLWEIKPRT